MAQRTVNGLFLDMQGDVVKALPVVLTQIGGFVGPDALRVRQVKHHKTTEAGLLSASLYVGGQYEVQYGGERFTFALPAGDGPLTWSEVRSLGVPVASVPGETILAYLQSRPELRGASALVLYRTLPGNEGKTLEQMFTDLTGADGTTPNLRLSGTVLEVLVGGTWQPLGDVEGPPGADGLLRTVPTLDDLSARPGDAAGTLVAVLQGRGAGTWRKVTPLGSANLNKGVNAESADADSYWRRVYDGFIQASWFLDGDADEAANLQRFLDACLGKVGVLPPGTVSFTQTLVLPGALVLLGSGMTGSRLVYTGPKTGVEDALRIVNPDTPYLRLADFRIEGAGRDNFHLENVHQWQAQGLWLQGGGRYGFYHRQSWKGKLQSVLANQNTSGIWADDVGAHGVTYDACSALGNLQTGLRPGPRSSVLGYVGEANGFTDLLIEKNGVSVQGSYYEGTQVPTDPANQHHILIRNCRGVVINADEAFVRVGTSVRLQNAKEVELHGISGDISLPTGGGPYNFDFYGHIALSVDKDSNVIVGGTAPNPWFAEDLSKVRWLKREDGPRVKDVLSGYGAMLRAGATAGLAEGWATDKPSAASAPTFTLEPERHGVGVQAQGLVSGSGTAWLRYFVPGGLKPSTLYTVGFYLENPDGLVLVSTRSTAGSAGPRGPSFSWYPSSRPRFCVASFTTGATQNNDIAALNIVANSAGSRVWVSQVKLLEGSFDLANFPLIGMRELPYLMPVTPPLIAAGAVADVEITVPTAKLGQLAQADPVTPLAPAFSHSAFIDTAGWVKLRLRNHSGAAATPAAGNWSIALSGA